MNRVLRFARLGAVFGVFMLFGTLENCVADFCAGLDQTSELTNFICGDQQDV